MLNVFHLLGHFFKSKHQFYISVVTVLLALVNPFKAAFENNAEHLCGQPVGSFERNAHNIKLLYMITGQ